MPIIVIALIGFSSGWAVGTFLETQAAVTDKCYRGLLFFLAFLAGVIVFGIAAGEASHVAGAFELEGALIEQRWCTVLLWVFAGFAVYPFRKAIGAFLADLTALALKAPTPEVAESKKTEEKPPKGQEVGGGGTELQPDHQEAVAADRQTGDPGQVRPPQGAKIAQEGVDTGSSKYLPLSLPWFVEAGIFGAFLVAAVFAFNPKMLSGLTSFKAGYIEAHFSTAGPVLQKGQVAVVDANRKSVLANWTQFKLDDPLRVEISKKSHGWNDSQFRFGKNYFDLQLHPLFVILHDREYSYLELNFRNFGILQDIATRLSNLIESSLDKAKKRELITGRRQVFVLKKVYQEILLFQCGTGAKDRPAQCNSPLAIAAAECMEKALIHEEEQCNTKYSIVYPDFISELEKSYNNIDEVAQNIWEPYIIQAVADLLGRSLSGRERANFLEVTTAFVEHDATPCEPACTFPQPGQMSLVYAAVEAKVESEQPWPFDHMYEQVANLLSDTRRVVDTTDLSGSARAVGRRNRLIDLSLGLQLFYQRALSGQRFSPAQIQSWLEWLKETRAALSLLESVGSSANPYIDDSEKAAWRDARETIENDPAVVQDAATAAALSSVLLPAQSDGTTSTDCLAARSLMDFASSRNLEHFYGGLGFDPDEKATYKGLIDQMKARVESECE